MKHLFKALGIALLMFASAANPSIRAQTPSVTTMQDAATATGNGTVFTIAGSATYPSSTLGALGVQITGTFSATITFEATTDGTNWAAIMATELADDSRATTATAAGHYTIVYGSAIQVRARISSYSSGTVTVKGRLIPGFTARSSGGGGGGITVGTTTITGGTDTRSLYNNAGVVGERAVTGTGDAVLSASPTLTGTLAAAAATFSSTIAQSSTSATAFTSGANGATNPSLTVDNSTASQASGITVSGKADGTAPTITVNSRTQQTNAIAGNGLAITADPAIAGSSAGTAAAGGNVTITAGAAARNTSGNANGGNIIIVPGASIGTGATGGLVFNAATSANIKLSQITGGADKVLAVTQANDATGNMGLLGAAFVLTQGVSDTGANLYMQAASSVGIVSGATTPIAWSSNTTAAGATLRDSRDLYIRRNAAANLAFGATDAASPVAQTLSVQNVVTGTSNTAGATWTHQGSLGTSQGAPGRQHFTGGAMITASGTTQQTAIDRLIVGATKVLTNNSATTIVNVTNASNTSAGGVLDYCIEVTDGTDTQYECGSATYGISNKAGAFSGNTVTKFGNHQNATSGTLTVTFAISGANPGALSINANSSLTPSTGYPRVVYSLRNLGNQAVSIQ